MSEKVAKKIRKIVCPELSSHVIGAHNIDEVISKITKRTIAPKLIVIDLFCGAGGTSTGFEMAGDDVMVIACVNHDYKAIKSHWTNHPHVAHFEEDIRKLDLRPLVKLLNHYRNLYPSAKVILWASLECTNFSKAKGGQPRDADSRTLADHLHRYIKALDPDFIQIENVVEFMSWGPLDENGKPVSRKNGQDFMRWRHEIGAHGYDDDWREMNSADFGAHTSRNRLFGMFARSYSQIVWPDPTHSKNPSKNAMFGDLKKWKAVKEVLDFSDEGESIFTRNKPLSDKTLERIYAGLIKYVAKGDTSFISKYYSGRPAGKVNSVEEPAATVTTVGNLTLVQPQFLTIYNGKSLYRSVEEPSPVIATNDRLALVQPEFFIDKHYGSNSQNQSIDQPAGTVMPNDKHRLVEVACLSQEVQIHCTCDHIFKTIISAYERMPCPNCGGFEGHVTFLNQAQPFIMPTNFNNKPTSIENPSPVITANRKHHYIVNPSHGGHSTSIDAPCPVIVARQDKAPLSCVSAEQGPVSVAVYPEDSPIMIKIKEFMTTYSLVDIKMRMLRVHELLRIQGFPEGYKLEGNQSDQKKFIGNSVVPHVVKVWAEALCDSLTRKVKVA